MKKYARYKDSGISWIGDVPEHWDVRYLFQKVREHYISNKEVHHQNLLSLSYGRIIQKDINKTEGLLPESFDTYQIVENGNIVLRLTDLQNDHKSLRVGLVTQEGIITSAYECLEVFDNSLLPVYLYYQLHSFDIKKMFYGMGGGLRQNLNYNELKKIRMVVPSLPEQKAIAEYLDKKTAQINELVSAKQKQIELLKEYKQSVIANAVTGKLDERREKRKWKDSGISWIGKIPENWEVDKLGHRFIQRKEKVSDKDYPPLSVSKMGVTPQLESACKTDDGDNRKLVLKGDFVVNSRSDRKGSCGLSELDGSVSLINIVATPRNIDGHYIHYLFRSNNYIEEFYRMGRGIVSDLWTTRWSEMRTIMIPVPPLSEQKEIVAYIEKKVSSIDSQIASIENQIANLNEYKQSLISDVVTGKVKVC